MRRRHSLLSAVPMLLSATTALGAANAPATEATRSRPTHSVGAELRLGILRSEARDIASDGGFGFGADARWWFHPQIGLRFGAAFDRFGGWRDTHEQLSVGSFDLLALAMHQIGPWVPWAGVGGGVAIGWFRSNAPALARPGKCALEPGLEAGVCPISASDVMPLARASFGLGYQVTSLLLVGLRGEYSLLFSETTVTAGQSGQDRTVRVFDDFAAVCVMAQRFF